MRDKPVTDAVHGFDETRFSGVVPEHAAQLRDHATQYRGRHVPMAPHGVEQTVAAEHLAWIREELEQDCIRLRFEQDRIPFPRDAVRTGIHFEISEHHYRAARVGAGHGLHSRAQG
ncbi:MAG: hypothetical protein ABIO49_05410 [Dokdonella sp.]